VIDIPRFRKRVTTVVPESKDPLECLDKFTYIDYRECQCNNIVTYLLPKLYWHMEKRGKLETLRMITHARDHSNNRVSS